MTMSTYFHRKHLKTNKNNICPLVPPSNWLSSLFEFYRKYTSLIHTSNYSWQKIFLCCFVAYHLRRIPKGARNQNRTFFLILPYLVIKPWHKFSESADFPFLFFFLFLCNLELCTVHTYTKTLRASLRRTLYCNTEEKFALSEPSHCCSF